MYAQLNKRLLHIIFDAAATKHQSEERCVAYYKKAFFKNSIYF